MYERGGDVRQVWTDTVCALAVIRMHGLSSLREERYDVALKANVVK